MSGAGREARLKPVALFPRGQVILFRREETFRGRAAFWARVEESVEQGE